MPFAQVRTAGGTLNGTSAPIAIEPADLSQPVRPTSGVAWDLVEVDAADVRQGAGGGVLDAVDLARLPASATLGRSNGIYVAFSRPSTAAEPHRVTMPDSVPDGSDMRQAQDKKRQQSFFDLTVGDVTVSVAGVTVAHGATVTLRATQRAEVVVAQTDGGRVYDVGTMRDRGGTRVRRRDEGTLVMVAAHAPSEPPEPVEVSRVYRVDPTTGRYASGGLAGRTMHLAKDLHVPVRSFSVRVVTTLDIRSAAVVDPAAPDANVVNGPDPANPAVALVPGLAMVDELFLFVPAAVVSGPDFAPANIAGAPVATVLTVSGVATSDLDEPTRRAAGDGAVYRLSPRRPGDGCHRGRGELPDVVARSQRRIGHPDQPRCRARPSHRHPPPGVVRSLSAVADTRPVGASGTGTRRADLRPYRNVRPQPHDG